MNPAPPANTGSMDTLFDYKLLHTIFQPYSQLYRHFLNDPQAMAEPLARVLHAFERFSDVLDEHLQSGKIKLRGVHTARNTQGDLLTYCEYAAQIPDRGDHDFAILAIVKANNDPHFLMHSQIVYGANGTQIMPQIMLAELDQAENGDPLLGALETRSEMVRGLCYADTSMRQILGGVPLLLAESRKWLDYFTEDQAHLRFSRLAQRDLLALMQQATQRGLIRLEL